MLEILDIMMRNASTGVFLFLGVLIIRDYGVKVASVLALLSTLTAAAYTICTQNWFSFDLANYFWPFVPFCIMGPVNIWLFSLSQFQDGFRLKPYHWLAAALYLLLNQITLGGYIQLPPVATDLAEVSFAALRFFFICHMLYAAWQGREGDLLEIRRRFRTIYVIFVGLVMATIFFMETFYTNEELTHPYISLVQAGVFFALAFVILWYATNIKPGLLLIAQAPGDQTPLTENTIKTTDATDPYDLDAITQLIEKDHLYGEPGLSISLLAEKAKLPEHRLRRLINQHLGYRNFADFLNSYRINEAKRLLAEPDMRHTQVLVIAMDLGYGSLGPFNRAFKARTGQTPSEYRKTALNSPDQNMS